MDLPTTTLVEDYPYPVGQLPQNGLFPQNNPLAGTVPFVKKEQKQRNDFESHKMIFYILYYKSKSESLSLTHQINMVVVAPRKFFSLITVKQNNMFTEILWKSLLKSNFIHFSHSP